MLLPDLERTLAAYIQRFVTTGIIPLKGLTVNID